MSLTGLPCPNCGIHLHLTNPSNATCPDCHREYIITLSDAYAPNTRDPRKSEFWPLIKMIEDLSGDYGRLNAGRRAAVSLAAYHARKGNGAV